MNLQYVDNFSDGKVVLLVYGEIGGENGVNGALMAQEIAYLQHLGEVTEIEVRINCSGGVVLDALNIFNAIRSSKKPCNTVIDGIAASSGGLIAMAGHKRMINDFGRLMVHAPSIPDKVKAKLDDSLIETLDQFQDLIADLLTANSKHNKTSIMSMIDAETWFTAEQALNAGFVDEILNTDRDFNEFFNELDLSKADLSLVVNNISNYKNIIKMKTIKNTLGLDENVSEAIVEAKVAEILNASKIAAKALETEQAEHGKTKGKLVKANEAVEVINDAAAISYVENAIKEGKFSPDKKETLIAQAKNNLDGFKTLCESIPAPAARITDGIKPRVDGDDGEVVDGKLNGKTLRELEKSNPELVKNMIASNSKEYKALFFAQYGTQPNE